MEDSNELGDIKEEEEEKKERKEFYKKYREFINELTSMEKQIMADLTTYREKVLVGGASTIEEENKIKKQLSDFTQKLERLEDAYSNRNAPSGYPPQELDRKQKELQKYRISYEDMKKQFNAIFNSKYTYKNKIGDDVDYMHKEEFKDVTNEELIQMQQDKLNQQDEKIDDITLDVKKNITLAKNVGHVLKEQNKKIDEINEDIDMTDDRMKTLTGRFANYAKSRSWCCLVIVLVIELAIALVAYFLLFN
jgi:syntaxin 6/SYP6 family syntaxin